MLCDHMIIQGLGTIAGLGQVSVTGSRVERVSLSGQLSTVETFTVSNAQGSVTIELTKLPHSASTQSTATSSYSIVKTTGAFQGDIGTGTADLHTITEAIPVGPSPIVARGVFRLTLL
jgi:hypothetical protein